MNENLAKQRFLALNLARILGLVLVFAGIANIGGRLLPALSPWLGYILLITGAVDFYALPILLKKAWSKQHKP